MGDIHGAALVAEVLEQARFAEKAVEVYGLGGQRMKAAGALLIGEWLAPRSPSTSVGHTKRECVSNSTMGLAAASCHAGDNTGLSSIGLLEALPLVVPSLQLQMDVRRFLKNHPPDVVVCAPHFSRSLFSPKFCCWRLEDNQASGGLSTQVLIDYPGVNIGFGKHLKENYGIFCL